jgi:hypothetical protein
VQVSFTLFPSWRVEVTEKFEMATKKIFRSPFSDLKVNVTWSTENIDGIRIWNALSSKAACATGPRNRTPPSDDIAAP